MTDDKIKEEGLETADELEDSFAEYFQDLPDEDSSEEQTPKKHKKVGPDILAISKTKDEGFKIKDVVAVNKPEETEEPSEDHKVVKPQKTVLSGTHKRTHKSMAVIGGAVTILALVGALTIIIGLVFGARSVLSGEKKRNELEWKIYPLLMLDPATFEQPMQLDQTILLKACMWQTVLENRTSYSYDENMMLLVPASDLDVAAKKLFGDGVTLNHQTLSDGYEFFYIYDEDNKTYQIPVSTQTAGYTPKIVKSSKTDKNELTLIVGYVPPTSLWNISEDGSSTEEIPEKYMYYVLEKLKGNNYIISAVRDIPVDELPDNLKVASQFSLNQGSAYNNYNEVFDDYINSENETPTDVESPTDATPTDVTSGTDA